MKKTITGLLAALALAVPAGAEAPPPLLTFYPQGGVIGQDLYITNYLDLDPGPAIRDWACGSHSYDGHSGQDSIVRSFREVRIGVPVYAARDGRVSSVQQAVGSDFQYGPTYSRFDNHIVLDHGDGTETVYGHLARRSMRVKVGQQVVAGEQIGLTASSGNSSWPHLHFTVRRDHDPYEPFAGPCREGASGWATQPEIRADAYVANVTLSPKPFTGQADLPHDEAVRAGAFVRGLRDVHARIELRNIAGAANGTLSVHRPDGSVAATVPFRVAGHRAGWASRRLRLNLAPAGRWTIAYELDGRELARAPFDVVTAARQVRNRPPAAVGVSLAPVAPRAGEVAVCAVATSLVNEDPDYDVVRYLYRWRAGGRLLRAVTSAALSDALPRTAVRAGETLTCEVTPSDGRLRGPAASVSASVG